MTFHDRTAQSVTDMRTRLSARGGGRPARFEKAQNPQQALLRLLNYLRPFQLTQLPTG